MTKAQNTEGHMDPIIGAFMTTECPVFFFDETARPGAEQAWNKKLTSCGKIKVLDASIYLRNQSVTPTPDNIELAEMLVKNITPKIRKKSELLVLKNFNLGYAQYRYRMVFVR